MAKFLYTQYSFSNGELNPRLLGRTDVKEYFNSGKEVTNFAVNTEGGLTQCMGTNWVGRSDNGYLFTFLDIFAFAVESGSPVIRRLQQDFSSESFTMSDISITISNGVTYWADFTYGTHITINKFTFITDLYGAVEPIVIEKNGDFSFKIHPYTAYAAIFGDPNLLLIERKALSTPMYVNKNLVNTMTVAGTTITSIEDTFVVGMINSHMFVSSGTVDYLYQITGYTSATQVTVAAIGTAAPNAVYPLNNLPSWYDGNWPKIVSFFEERLLVANTNSHIDSMWASEVFNIARFSLPILGETISDQSAFDIVPSTIDVSPIMWVLPERYIALGTQTEEYIVDGSDGIFTIATARVRSVSKYGSHSIGLAFRAQSSTYFVERGGKVLREMSFSEENGGYVTRNIGVLGPDITNITNLVYDYATKRIYIESNGVYIVAIDPSSGVLGWSKINSELLSFSGILEFNGSPVLLGRSQFKDSMIIMYREGVTSSKDHLIGQDRLYFWQVDGDDYSLPSRYNPGAFVPGTTTILVHNPVTDAYEATLLYLASGHATFLNGTYYVTTAFVASQFAELVMPKARLETTPIQQGSPIGDAQISFQKTDKVGLRLYEASGKVSVGSTETSLEDLEYITPFTGVWPVSIDGEPEIDHTIIVENTSIHPVVILGIMARGTGQEG